MIIKENIPLHDMEGYFNCSLAKQDKENLKIKGFQLNCEKFKVVEKERIKKFKQESFRI